MASKARIGLIPAVSTHPRRYPSRYDQAAMIEKHLAFIEDAAKQGLQMLCMQELFYGPYFCAEQETKWYDLTEPIPDGPTTRLMESAKTPRMVIVVPMYERNGRCLLQYGVRYRRRRHLPRQISKDSYSTLPARILGEVLFSTWQPWLSGFRYSHRKCRRLYLLRSPFS